MNDTNRTARQAISATTFVTKRMNAAAIHRGDGDKADGIWKTTINDAISAFLRLLAFFFPMVKPKPDGFSMDFVVVRVS